MNVYLCLIKNMLPKVEWWRENRQPNPVGLEDQLQAAAAEANTRLPGLAWAAFGHLGDLHQTDIPGGDGGAKCDAVVLAAFSLPWLRCCPHGKPGSPPIPLTAVLACRTIVCTRCIHDLPDPPAEDSSRCDLCGRYGIETFMPFVIRMGQLTALGDCCDDCGGPIAEAFGVEVA